MFEQWKNHVIQTLDIENVKRMSMEIYRHDRTLCYSEFAKTAQFCAHELQRYTGCPVTLLPVAADGQTAYLDDIPPQAWEFSSASLKVLSGGMPELTSAEHGPFLVGNRCHPTPLGGVTAEVISLDQLRQGASAFGKFVWFRHPSPARAHDEIAQSGACGMLSSYSEGPENAPNSCWWINGWGPIGWYHTQNDDKKLFCFSCPPVWGDLLEKKLALGSVTIHAQVESRVYNGTLDMVNGRTSGNQEREILLVSHLYEPFLSDNAIGSAGCLEIARIYETLRRQGVLPHNAASLRILLSMERYGFSPYFTDSNNCRRALCSINTDTIGRDINKMRSGIALIKSPASLPFFGDLLFKQIMENMLPDFASSVRNGSLSDDMFMSDRTLGVPSNWLLTSARGFHHNGYEQADNLTDWEMARKLLAATATYAITLATSSANVDNALSELIATEAGEELRTTAEQTAGLIRAEKLSPAEGTFRYRHQYEWQKGRLQSLNGFCAAQKIETALAGLQYDSRFSAGGECYGEMAREKDGVLARVLARVTPGLPLSLSRVPGEKRKHVIYFSYAVMNWFDGRRTLGECIRRAALDEPVAAQTIPALLEFLDLLVEYGYLKDTKEHTSL